MASTADRPGVIYLTGQTSTHDLRMVNAALELGWKCEGFDLGVSQLDSSLPSASLGELLAGVSANQFPARYPVIHAGPLHLVSPELIAYPGPLVAMSFGYDVLQLATNEPIRQKIKDVIVRADALIVDNQATFNALLALGADRAKIVCFAWGVDLQKFRRQDASRLRQSLKISSETTVVFSIRQHEPLYRVSDLVTAFAQFHRQLPSSILLLAGSGSESENLKELASQLGIADQTRFVGYLAESDLPGWLSMADRYVSTSEVDGTSISLLQAMACGTPVVCSLNVGAATWAIDGITAQTFAVGDIDGLAEALAKPSSESIVQAASQLVRQQADWSTNMQGLTQAYEIAESSFRNRQAD